MNLKTLIVIATAMASWLAGARADITSGLMLYLPLNETSGTTASDASGNGYNATSSGGSNLGPTSQKLNDAIKDRVDAYRKENGLNEREPVPADAVTASGSGLDPYISVRNAELQIPRVAKARGLSEKKLHELIEQNTDGRDLGLLGDPGVNVLSLNRALASVAARP